jgi:hypothetical protein
LLGLFDIEGWGGPVEGDRDTGKKLKRSAVNAGLLAGNFLPGAGVTDYLGKYPSAEGGFEPGAAENFRQGNYGTAALQLLGAGGDMLYAIPAVGATVGSALKAPRAAQKALQASKAAPAADEYASLLTKANELDEKIRLGDFSIKDVNERAKILKRSEELKPELFPTSPPVVQDQPIGLLDTSYRGSHTAPNRDFGAQLFELNKIYPDDIYSPNAARFYGHGGDDVKVDQKSAQIIRSFRGKPDAEVTIYRAVPKNESIKDINAGDWVTINRDYAKVHGESVLRGEYKVLEKKVKAKDIWTNADSIHEFGYDPS